MTISDQITRLNNAKAAIKTSIENKGVTVSSTAKLDEYAALIDSIEVGSGNGGGETYEHPDFYELRTTNGTNYKGLFSYYNSYKTSTLDLSSFDTSKVTTMSQMFYFSVTLKGVDLSNFNTSNVTDMSDMFYYCSSLTTLDLSSFNTSKVTNMNRMFYCCNGLTSLDLSNFDTSKVTDMSYMFYDCDKLETLDLSNWDISKVTNMSYMFQYCDKLTSLDLSSWDIGKVTASYAISNAFNCKALTDFKAPKNINATFDFSKCTKLTHDSLMSIINNLATVTSTTKLTLGATNLAKLTDDELAIAVNRGWTLA